MGVVNLGSLREKASEGAERSCRKAKVRRGRRSRGKKRAGKVRSGTQDRPSGHTRSTFSRDMKRRSRAEDWNEKRASSFLERLEEIREWEKSQKKHDAMRALRKSFILNRKHVEKIFGSSICWSQFLYLSNVLVWKCNPDLAISIIQVSWEDCLRGTNISETRPKQPPAKFRKPTRFEPLLSLHGRRAEYRNGVWVTPVPSAFGVANQNLLPKKHTLPMKKSIEQDEVALRPPPSSVTSNASRCIWCGERKGVVHGNMPCDRARSTRGRGGGRHQFSRGGSRHF